MIATLLAVVGGLGIAGFLICSGWYLLDLYRATRRDRIAKRAAEGKRVRIKW